MEDYTNKYKGEQVEVALFGGEYQEGTLTAYCYVDDVARDHPDETVLVVAHGGTLRVVHAIAAGLDYVRDRDSIPGVPNCTLARYAVRDGKLAPVD